VLKHNNLSNQLKLMFYIHIYTCPDKIYVNNFKVGPLDCLDRSFKLDKFQAF
jgi:hypothetical protein